MKPGNNIWHTTATVSASVSFGFACFIIFLTKAFSDFELLVLCLVVVHKGILQDWPRVCVLTCWGKVAWTCQCCAQGPAALKAFLKKTLYNFSSVGLLVLVRSVRQCAGNKLFLHICTQSYCSYCSSFPHKLPTDDCRPVPAGRCVSIHSHCSCFRDHPLQSWALLGEHLCRS